MDSRHARPQRCTLKCLWFSFITTISISLTLVQGHWQHWSSSCNLKTFTGAALSTWNMIAPRYVQGSPLPRLLQVSDHLSHYYWGLPHPTQIWTSKCHLLPSISMLFLIIPYWFACLPKTEIPGDQKSVLPMAVPSALMNELRNEWLLALVWLLDTTAMV